MSYEYDDFEDSWAPEIDHECVECGADLYSNQGSLCEDCDYRDEEEDYDEEYYYGGDVGFADPGGRSALRAAGPGNPRNLPCPTCYEPNRLTPADKARGYQCDSCADALEGGY